MPSFTGAVAGVSAAGIRLDRYVAETLRLLSRSQIKARRMRASVNGKEAKVSFPVKPGDVLELSWPEAEPAGLVPEDIPLDVIYEDGRVIVIDKAQGMVVHPGAGNRAGTLANALFFRRLQRGLGEGAGLRPGIVHRLDKDTSGVMIAAYDEEALAFLAGQFKSRRAKKRYVAVVTGVFRRQEGRVETFIERHPKDRKRFAVGEKGRHAVTSYRVLKSWQKHSLVLLSPKTGRTHQLRVHLRHLGHPVVGDRLYGFADPCFADATLMLHARSLTLALPGDIGERLFRAPLPERFRWMLKRLDVEGA